MSRILFVLTNHDRMLNGDPTGVWLEEFAVPYQMLREKGHEVTVSSVAGGQVPVDPNSAVDDDQARAWQDAIDQLASTPAFETLDTDNYDAVYMPGGHGTVFDMPYNRKLHELLFSFENSDRIIASVCHAPAVFGGMRRDDATPFIQGRRVAGFTDSEEKAVGGEEKVPFLLESRLKELGAKHEATDDWNPLAIQDGKLITGQNPQSSAAVAEKLIAALQ
ncbi:type 1 glutamine amidotransferase domain-containing protein [Salicola sp. Rm-C-2C1-2]|uniref:type 1 glutamine amidotransferase domain-containing protein n=1 Tax=Salicola sp. Rm-C-2C1-2 TaxID=3141321 RepID=UPI0032E4ECE8